MFWLAVFLVFLLLGLLDFLWKRDVNKKLRKIPCPLNVPIIGAMWIYSRQKPDELLEMSVMLRERFGPTVRAWIFQVAAVHTSDLAFIQEILSHPVEIKKNRMYGLLSAWLGEGLLMSNGAKWLSRRRVITPTFHFKILEEFVQIFDQQSLILAKKLDKHSGQEAAFNVEDYVALATLDIVCETAMGVKINAQTDEYCEYVLLLKEMTKIILRRFVNIAYRVDFIFSLFAPALARHQKKVLGDLHAFTERIIMERREEMLHNVGTPNDGMKETDSTDVPEDGIKTRMALLDVLLSSTINEKPLTNADIREEVDTFMFEGHDTTKSGIGYTLYLNSRHPSVQQKVFDEISAILGNDPKKEITYRHLMDMKYLELVIKESLRMFPPVPFIGRQIANDCVINGVCFPKGVNVLMDLMSLQNNPELFPEPHRFLPERSSATNSAFAFVPFSAGPRNCIGQRFAMLEMKAIIARIIQRHELLPLGADVKPAVSVVLKSKTGWQMGFRKRTPVV